MLSFGANVCANLMLKRLNSGILTDIAASNQPGKICSDAQIIHDPIFDYNAGFKRCGTACFQQHVAAAPRRDAATSNITTNGGSVFEP